MTKNKILLIFFALVSFFRLFADDYADCTAFKRSILNQCDNISGRVTSIQTSASDISAAAGSDQYAILARASSIAQSASYISEFTGEIRGRVNSIICSSNDTCSVDLLPLSSLVSNIYEVLVLENISIETISDNCDLLRLTLDDINNRFTSVSYLSYYDSYVNVFDSHLFSAVSNLEHTVAINANSVSNLLSLIRSDLSDISSSVSLQLSTMSNYLRQISNHVAEIDYIIGNLSNYIVYIYNYTRQYLPYLETISNDLKAISTNGFSSIDQSYTNQFYYSNLLSFDRFRYYAQGQLNNTQPSLYPLSPYDNIQNLRNATIYDAVAGGFESLLISQGSINNYLYWLKAIAGSNRLESVENHIIAVSNLVRRLDDYVLNDFSNEIARISYNLSYLTNRVDYTTNLVHLTELVETNNIFLSSIDSKLDVLDYIKILSTTPFSEYSGDVDYYDFLTNLYINGSADSGGVSTNWFERMEILLASLVFGDSDGTNDIPQSVEMEGVDSSAVETALTDYTYNQEFTAAINALDDTSQSFIGVLNGLHTSIKSVSLPASISIGLGGLDGEDTHDFKDMMHGHFQVSFNTGIADRFTIAVRAVTTVSWILLFFLALWKSGFYLIRKLVYFYRLVTRLLVSVFTR